MISQENMLPVGTLLLGKTYSVEKQLASGGFGNTYVVKKVYFNETYAMKEFFMKSINLRQGNEVTVSVPDNHATFESQREKFKKEALRLREINNPHIVRVHDLFEENGTVYYVMDYIDGIPLTRESKPLSENEAMDVLHQVLQALKVIHSQSPQMLHLDIKPSNLMMDRQGRVFLIDFGSSKQLDAEHGITVSSGITLTKGYAPSELEDGKKERIGSWTDLYELGATLYNLLTCQQPPTPSEILEDEATAFRFPATVSQSTRELITWMMTPNRRKRPQSLSEVCEYLKKHGMFAQKYAKEQMSESLNSIQKIETTFFEAKQEYKDEETSFSISNITSKINNDIFKTKNGKQNQSKTKVDWKDLGEILIVGSICISLMGGVLITCDRNFRDKEIEELNEAINSNNIEVMEKYIRNHPLERTDSLRQRIESIKALRTYEEKQQTLYDQALKSDDIEIIRSCIKEYEHDYIFRVTKRDVLEKRIDSLKGLQK